MLTTTRAREWLHSISCVLLTRELCSLELKLHLPRVPEASVYGEAPPVDVIHKMDAIDVVASKDLLQGLWSCRQVHVCNVKSASLLRAGRKLEPPTP